MFPLRVISNRHPFAPPALPGLIATMDGSDFRMPPPATSLLTLVDGCPLPADRLADLLGYRLLSMSGSTRPRTPGSTPHHLPWRSGGRGLPVGQYRRHSPAEFFGALHLQGRLHPLPLHLACFRAYASACLLPVTRQGSIPGSWLAFTRAGFSPARVGGIAKPHCPPLLPFTYPPLFPFTLGRYGLYEAPMRAGWCTAHASV